MNTVPPTVLALQALLQSRPDLTTALTVSLQRAARPGVPTLADYFAFLQEMVTLIPTDRNLHRFVLQFYYLIDQSPDGLLRSDESFQTWSRTFAQDWGLFLDTPASAAGIASFRANPDYHFDDYAPAPSGWLTFNQFFARHVRPGKRPIAGLCDDRVVVSPADSVYQGQWRIDAESSITAKGFTWSVPGLLAGSPYRERFQGGVFTHSFLNVNDYHHFHVPVGGLVKEVRKIPGHVTMDVVKRADESLGMVDGTGYQFSQDRGLIVIDSPVGLVAVLPIGMAQVSSVNLTVEVGSTLHKGEEFGYFSFGGSDIVTLFEPNRVELTAKIDLHYKQGRQIGHAR